MPTQESSPCSGIHEFAGFSFQRAETQEQLAQVHRLNYETFVREIPQHPDSGKEHLIDKFHCKNLYILALRGEKLVGMVAVHGEPPFSAAEALANSCVLTTAGRRVLEARLLAVKPTMRHRFVFCGLIWSVYEYAALSGYTHLVISALRERQELYKQLGFEPLGPPVQRGQAYFAPMLLALAELPDRIRRDIVLLKRRLSRQRRVDADHRRDT